MVTHACRAGSRVHTVAVGHGVIVSYTKHKHRNENNLSAHMLHLSGLTRALTPLAVSGLFILVRSQPYFKDHTPLSYHFRAFLHDEHPSSTSFISTLWRLIYTPSFSREMPNKRTCSRGRDPYVRACTERKIRQRLWLL